MWLSDQMVLENVLYVLNTTSLACFSDSHAIVAHIVSKHTWHSRLGHVSFQKLDKLKSLLKYRDAENVPCSVCPLNKQRKLSFISNNNLS